MDGRRSVERARYAGRSGGCACDFQVNE